MPIGTPFHSRTSALCESMSWRDWAGYFAALADAVDIEIVVQDYPPISGFK